MYIIYERKPIIQTNRAGGFKTSLRRAEELCKSFYTGIRRRRKIYLNEEQSRHLAKSLRMKAGDMITVCSGTGEDYGCMIDEIGKEGVVLSVCYRKASESEPDIKVSLYQGVPKGDKMEDIIQKCVELGIHDITPMLTKRSVSRPQEKQAEKKRIRYSKISLEAAQQSGRGIVPQINKMISLKEAVAACDADCKIVFTRAAASRFQNHNARH